MFWQKNFLINKMGQDWAQIVLLDLKNTNSNIILIRVEKRGREEISKKIFLHVFYEFGLKLRVLNSGILIRISFRSEVRRGVGGLQKEFSSCFLQITHLEVKNTNANIILIRVEVSGAG